MTQPPVSLSQHLLTRSDLAKLGIPAGRILTWLGNGWLDQVGTLPGHGTQGDPVFAVLLRELRHELANRLLEIGKDTVVFSPLRVRSLLMRSLLLQQHGTTATERPAAPATVEPPEADPVVEALLDPDVADALRSTAHELVREVDTVLELAREEARLEAIEQAAEAAAGFEGDSMGDDYKAGEDDTPSDESQDVDFFDVDDLADELGVWTEDPPGAVPAVEEPVEDQAVVHVAPTDDAPSPAEPLASTIVELTQGAETTHSDAQNGHEEATRDDHDDAILEPEIEQNVPQLEQAERTDLEQQETKQQDLEQLVPDHVAPADDAPSPAEPLASTIAKLTQGAETTHVDPQNGHEEATRDDHDDAILEPEIEQNVPQLEQAERADLEQQETKQQDPEQPVPDHVTPIDDTPSPAEPLASTIAELTQGAETTHVDPQNGHEEATRDDHDDAILEPEIDQNAPQLEQAERTDREQQVPEHQDLEQLVPDHVAPADDAPSPAEPLASTIAELTQGAETTHSDAQNAHEEATREDHDDAILEPESEQNVPQLEQAERADLEQQEAKQQDLEHQDLEQLVPDHVAPTDDAPSPAEPLASTIAVDVENPSEHNIEPTVAGVVPAEGFVSHAEQAELAPTTATANTEAAESSPLPSPAANALEDMLSAPTQQGEAGGELAAMPPAGFEVATPPPEVPKELLTEAPSATATESEPARQEPTEVVTSDAAMQRVERFLGELRGVLVELATRPPAPPVDVQPLVAAVQQGFTQARDQSQATDTALASLTNRIGDFGEKVEHGVALAVHAALGNHSTAAPGPVMSAPTAFVVPRQDRTTVALFAIGFLVLCWTVIFWFKTGSPRLALGTLIGANVVGCCLLVGRRSS